MRRGERASPLRRDLWYNSREIMPATAKDYEQALGRSPDRLNLDERLRLAGKYIALEFYTPDTLPLRRIEAIGDSLEECVRMLKKRGLDPSQFEYTRLPHPY